MPTEREREYYRMGFSDGFQDGVARSKGKTPVYTERGEGLPYKVTARKPQSKRKLSGWNKFVKANSKKPRFRYKSGSKRGKLNLKALGVAYRKKKR